MFTTWQEFIQRSDNTGKSIIELQQKYLKEQLIFEQEFNSYLQQLNPNPSTASGGRIQTPTSSPYPLIRLEFDGSIPGDYGEVGSGWYFPDPNLTGAIRFDFNTGYLTQGEYSWEIGATGGGPDTSPALLIGYTIGKSTSYFVNFETNPEFGTVTPYSGTFTINEDISSLSIFVWWQYGAFGSGIFLNYLTLTQTA